MITPSYVDSATGASAHRIDALTSTQLRIDRNGVAEFFSPEPSAAATSFIGVERRWDPLNTCSPAARDDAGHVLHRAVERSVEGAARPVVALSGGIDSLALALLLGDVLGHAPATATLVTELPGYCEHTTTARAAELLGVELVEIRVSAHDIVDVLPEAVRAAEVPMYNLHPVTKWLFAERAAALGFDRVITGDGADQVIAHDSGVDYLPVVASIFAASDADVRWPFLDRSVVDMFATCRPDPNKAALRSFVADRVGTDLAATPKRPGFTPPLDLERHTDVAAIGRLANELGRRVPNVGTCDDATLTRWVTLALLAESHC